MVYTGAMVPPLLATKLFIPPPRPHAVLRARLTEQLNAGLHQKLTLIAAPAGFGKTTLVSQWVAGSAQPTAWLALDAGDNDPARFLAYLVAAFQTLAPTLGADVLEVLQAPQLPPLDVIMIALLNEITTLLGTVVLVLDDHHLIEAPPVDHALAFLLEHLPPQMHLVIVTREDPQLPLARLRAQGQLTELRAADLRFTAAEAAAFLNPVMGLQLSAADIATLEARTEGWIAGLQLAALSLQGHQDIPGFIQAFAGDHRYIVDYLVAEVLQRQPAPVRSFLLQTSMLDRLSGSLCDAVTGQEGGGARLEALERGNVFVVPLDDQRHWYRYHHLFADVLAAHLRAEQPTQVANLHRRASAWHAQDGSPPDAIRHALAAQDFAHAADLIEQAIPAMRRRRQEATLLGWLKAIPDALIRCRPVLSAVYGGALLSSGDFAGVEARLRDAERWLDTPIDTNARPDAPAGAMVVVDEAAFRLLPGAIAVWRAGHALVLGDVAATVTYTRRALDLLPTDDDLGRGGAIALLGLAYWTGGELEAAHRSFADGLAKVQRAGHRSDAISGAIALADIRTAQGRRHEAIRTYEQALRLATEHGTPLLRGTADLYVGMSEFSREQNDLHTATQHLLTSQELGEHTGFPYNRSRWCAAMARIREAQGDLDGALDLLDEAERRYEHDFFPTVRPVAALKTRVWVAQGRLGEALGWVRTQGLSAQDERSYLCEFAHVTLSRVLVARATYDGADHAMREAMELLERLLHAAEAGERTGSVIEILVLQALAHQTHGDRLAALVPLSRALTLAAPEGYVRVFVDEGPPMAALLGRMKDAGGRMQEYVVRLLAAFGAQEDVPPSSRIPHPLTDPLSQRELTVLRLLNTELSGPEIARELMIALSTVRTYTKSIYSKLNVTTRRAAVKRASALGLI